MKKEEGKRIFKRKRRGKGRESEREPKEEMMGIG